MLKFDFIADDEMRRLNLAGTRLRKLMIATLRRGHKRVKSQLRIAANREIGFRPERFKGRLIDSGPPTTRRPRFYVAVRGGDVKANEIKGLRRLKKGFSTTVGTLGTTKHNSAFVFGKGRLGTVADARASKAGIVVRRGKGRYPVKVVAPAVLVSTSLGRDKIQRDVEGYIAREMQRLINRDLS